MDSRDDPPQVWRRLPAQGLEQSESGAAMEPSANELPQ